MVLSVFFPISLRRAVAFWFYAEWKTQLFQQFEELHFIQPAPGNVWLKGQTSKDLCFLLYDLFEKDPSLLFFVFVVCCLFTVQMLVKKKKRRRKQSEESNSLTLQIAANVKQGSHTGPAAKILSERATCTSEPCKSFLTSVSGLGLFVFLGRLIWLPSGSTKWSVTVYPDNLRQPVMKSARQALQMGLES